MTKYKILNDYLEQDKAKDAIVGKVTYLSVADVESILDEVVASDCVLADVRLSLPDNQEIERESECLIAKYQKVNDTLGLGFRAGAKWMRDEIVSRNGSEA